ncbi:MAG: hypothetical protein NVSMB26_25180 [Beijerinckiaceae bacterium]
MDFISTFSVISKAIEAGNAVLSINAEFDKATLKIKISEMTSALLDSKLALTRANEELGNKDKEIEQLKADFAFRKEETVVVGGYRYERRSDDGGPQGVAFCDRCERVDGRLIRVAKTIGKNGYEYKCPQCKADYGRHTREYLYKEHA